MLSQRMQANLLYRYFVENKDMEIDPARLIEPWRTIFLLADRAMAEYDGVIFGMDGIDYVKKAAKTVAGADEDLPQQWIDTIYASAEPLYFPTLAEIAENLEPVTWLWENWVPRGMLSMVGAYQGTGKSYLVMDLARIVLHGSVWPDGAGVQHTPATAKVVYLDAEGIPQVNSERATSMGVDTRRMYLLTADVGELLDLTKQYWRDRLLDLVYTIDPQLIIVDSLNSITSTSTKSVDDVSNLLAFLSGVAREFDTALILVHHLRKPGGGQLMLPGISIHDFQGSTHITAVARSVIGMSVVQQKGRQFSLNGPRQIEVVKTNLTPVYPDRLEVKLEQPDAGVIRFAYGKAEPVKEAEPTAEEWLLDYLEANGPTKPSDVVAEGIAGRFSESTIYRARKRLKNRIHNTKGEKRRGNLWTLDGGDEEMSDDEAED